MAEPLTQSQGSEKAMRPEIERCRSEIAGIEAQLRSSHRDLQGLVLALIDWPAELRMLQREAAGPLQVALLTSRRIFDYDHAGQSCRVRRAKGERPTNDVPKATLKNG